MFARKKIMRSVFLKKKQIKKPFNKPFNGNQINDIIYRNNDRIFLDEEETYDTTQKRQRVFINRRIENERKIANLHQFIFELYQTSGFRNPNYEEAIRSLLSINKLLVKKISKLDGKLPKDRQYHILNL